MVTRMMRMMMMMKVSFFLDPFFVFWLLNTVILNEKEDNIYNNITIL